MRAIIIVLSVLAASCAEAKPKPPVVVKAPEPPLPEYADGESTAKMLEAQVAVAAARLRYIAALEEFERKHKIKVAQGEGWDEVGADGKPCVNINDCRLKIRRIPPAPPAKPPAK